MQYSFEHWAGKEPETPDEGGRFPFSDDLKELEESLAMGFNEGMATLRAQNAAAPEAARLSDEQMDALAKTVADHVLTSLHDAQNPLQTELSQARRKTDDYYRDNRAMARQIQQLLAEREQMIRQLMVYESELARYRSLMGNLYLKY